jgi:Protein of unknown function (DUF1552)
MNRSALGKPQQGEKQRSRRRFLAALGAAGCSSLLEGTRAHAAAEERKALRFVGIYAPHGCVHELWKPGPDFELRAPNSTLQPFDDPDRFGRSFKANLLVIDGLDLAAGIEVGTVGHDASRVLFTGSGVHGTNASLDQFLAQEAMLGAETPLTSLVLAVGNDSTDLGSNVSYSALGAPMPKSIDPVRVFDELFGRSLTAEGRAELALRRRRGQSVLDVVRADLQRLEQQTSGAERAKLQQHHSALREIEKRLSPIERVCAAPERPDATRFPRLKSFGGGEPYFELITELQIDLLARALACDLTRFATLMLPELSRTGTYRELPSDVHTDVAHRYRPRTERDPGDPESWLALGLQNRHSYRQVARLAQRLAESNSLEDSVIYVSSDMGDPARHSSRNVPTLLIGGAGSGLSFGRVVDLRTGKGQGLRSHNHLLVSLLQVFGVERDHFGSAPNPNTSSGRLSELHA